MGLRFRGRGIESSIMLSVMVPVTTPHLGLLDPTLAMVVMEGRGNPLLPRSSWLVHLGEYC